MRVENVKFTDIECSARFFQDYDSAPNLTKKAVDKLVRLIMDSGKIPNSMNVHKAESNCDVWIGYVTRTGQHWRVLFFVDDSRLVFDRLIDHDTMNIELRTMLG